MKYKEIKIKGRDKEGLVECECRESYYSFPAILKVDRKRLSEGTADLCEASSDELADFLIHHCFSKEQVGGGRKMEDSEYDYYHAICRSLSKYSDDVSILNDERCQHCGGTLVRLHYKEFEEEPGVYYCRPPHEGALVICKDCRKVHSFQNSWDDVRERRLRRQNLKNFSSTQ